MHVQEKGPYHIPAVAEKGPSETEPRPVDTQPADLEASTAGRPSDGCALQTHTASQSALAVPGSDLEEQRQSVTSCRRKTLKLTAISVDAA